MEELIKNMKGDKKAEDRYAFNQLSQSDQERVGDLLEKVDIRYRKKWDGEEQPEEQKNTGIHSGHSHSIEPQPAAQRTRSQEQADDLFSNLKLNNQRSTSMAGKLGGNIKKQLLKWGAKVNAMIDDQRSEKWDCISIRDLHGFVKLNVFYM